MRVSDSSDSDPTLEIGVVFTPDKWAQFAIERFNIFQKWIDGATVFDPTMGEGNLIFSLIDYGLQKGYSLENLPIRNLYGVEINSGIFRDFQEKASAKYGNKLIKSNFKNEDIFFQDKEKKFDLIFGNPPWQNFVDLPGHYKQKIKAEFFRYDLIGNTQDLLLGGSRIDIAALVINKTIEKNLRDKGEAVFFFPLSLLLNDGANKFFRKYNVNGVNYCINKVIDFNDLKTFEGIATRYGLLNLRRDEKQRFPIEYERWENKKWCTFHAKPLLSKNDPLSILEDKDVSPLIDFKPITIKKYSKPRQGINTCGANHLYFFDSIRAGTESTYLVSNKKINAELPKKYLHPLVTSKNFSEHEPGPHKWVFLPYRKDGRPIEYSDVEQDRFLLYYLEEHRDFLAGRKGSLINAWIKRGYWWALLGVGEYNFFDYKVVWEAYGKHSFHPKIFQGKWQANQSLQAFMPVKSLDEAMSVASRLQDSAIENYLLSLKMNGTMNWAQPGKIKKLLQFEEEALRLF